MAHPTIRRAEVADAETLARLGERTFRETFLEGGFEIPYPAADLKAFLDGVYTAEAFAADLADPAQACWIALRDETPVAYASVGPCRLPHDEAAADDAQL